MYTFVCLLSVYSRPPSNVYFVQKSRHILDWNDQTGAVPNNSVPSLMLDVYFAASHLPVISVKWCQKKKKKGSKPAEAIIFPPSPSPWPGNDRGVSRFLLFGWRTSKCCSLLSPSNFKNSKADVPAKMGGVLVFLVFLWVPWVTGHPNVPERDAGCPVLQGCWRVLLFCRLIEYQM